MGTLIRIKSVRTMVAFRYSLLFGLLAFAIALGVYAYLRQDAYGRLDRESKALLQAVELNVEHEIEDHDTAERSEQSLRGILESSYQTTFPQEQITVWEGGRLVAYKRNLGRKQEDLRLVRPAGTAGFFDNRDLRIATNVFRSPVNGITYQIAVSVWRGDTQNDLKALSTGLVIVIPLAFLLAAGAGFLVARQTLAPLADMAQAMDAITSRTLDERVQVRSRHDEIGRLEDRFNQLLERLQSAFQQQQRFMADASHELRTPVAAALTAAQVTLRDPHRAAEQYREALQIVEEQMLRLRRIVEDMLLLARADSDSVPLRLETFYLDELVAEACRAMRMMAEKSCVQLQVAGPMPEAPIYGDAGLVRQALIILLDNARKYNRRGGSIHVSLEKIGDRCAVRVMDSGCGIPTEARPHLFERFFRADMARTQTPSQYGQESGAGVGLGLAIALWIAEQHHGALRLEESSDEGSTFVLELARPNGGR